MPSSQKLGNRRIKAASASLCTWSVTVLYADDLNSPALLLVFEQIIV